MFENFDRSKDKNLWKSEIEKDLKGKPLEKLFWRTYEGFDVENYYKAEDIENLDHLNTVPGKAPFIRSSKEVTDLNNWSIGQEISNTCTKTANGFIKRGLETGVQSFTLNFDKRIKKACLTCCDKADGINFRSTEKFNNLFEGIDIEKVPFNFKAGRSSSLITDLFIKAANGKNIKGSVDNDFITEYAFTGSYGKTLEERISESVDIFNTTSKFESFHPQCIDVTNYHEAGANVSMEIAFALSTAVDYIDLYDGKVSAEDFIKRVRFNFPAGQYYLMEIAKFRAFRYLWYKITREYTCNEELGKANIHATTSKWTMTKYDPNVNMLRETTEAMSAVLGGVDELTVLPFDVLTKEPNEFSYRIAKNVQLLMKEECHFDTMVDPAGGSYYIEKLTSMIIEKAWEIFLAIQANGGMTKSIESGVVFNYINAVKAKKDKNIDFRSNILVGTNQYPNIGELLSKSEERTYKYEDSDEMSKIIGTNCAKAVITPINTYRAAEAFETIRMATEAHTEKTGKRPTAFLATIGNLTMRKARASFAMGFLGAAGFDIIDNNGFKTAEDAVSSFVKSNAEIIVICSSDEEYAEVAAPITKLAKTEKPGIVSVLAGYPQELVESLKEAGVDEFIHMKASSSEVLSRIQKVLGINN